MTRYRSHLERWTTGRLRAALPTKWSPVTAPATSYGGDQRRLRRRELELEEEGESEDAREARMLTLDALVLAVVKKVAGIDDNRARRSGGRGRGRTAASAIEGSPTRFPRARR